MAYTRKFPVETDDMAQFPLGRIFATPGCLVALEAAAVSASSLLDRHASGDWGDLGIADKLANEIALEQDTRVLSMYTLPTGARVWIIKEWDRSATTLLLPSEN